MRTYKCLSGSEWNQGNYKVIPVRYDDRESIRTWRNEQIEILRQKKPVSSEEQDNYFTGVVEPLFEQYQPSQLLFSILENDNLIGYGGLVHIDWDAGNAEISFLTETTRNRGGIFEKDLSMFIEVMKQIAFGELSFHKIHTTVYDIRPAYINCILELGFREEGRLKEHVFVGNNLHDVLIFSLFNSK